MSAAQHTPSRVTVSRTWDGTWFASAWDTVESCGTMLERRIAFVRGLKSENEARAAIAKATGQEVGDA